MRPAQSNLISNPIHKQHTVGVPGPQSVLYPTNQTAAQKQTLAYTVAQQGSPIKLAGFPKLIDQIKESESNKSFIKVNTMSIQEEAYQASLNDSVVTNNRRQQPPIVVPTSNHTNYLNAGGSKENSNNIRSNLQEGPSKAYGVTRHQDKPQGAGAPKGG